MEKVIKYIGFYALPQSRPNRIHHLSATNKMDYVCDAINRAGYGVHLISPSWIQEKDTEKIFYTQETIFINEQKSLTHCPGLSGIAFENKTVLYFNIILALVWLFLYLLVTTRRNEKILAYHTPWIALPLRMAKYLRHFQLILEVEEIYNDVWDLKKVLAIQEQLLIKQATKFIVASEVLAEQLDSREKIILHGAYRIKNVRKTKTKNVHIVYAGSIDSVKGGAFNIVKCAKFLDDKYICHILGFGSQQMVNELNSQIKEVNEQVNREACIYHGVLHGEEFDSFLQNCDIGVNPQYSGDYMNTAFPSKVLVYLSNNLRVVSSPIISIKRSNLSRLIVFSVSDEPQAIASAIKSIDLNETFESQSIIKVLDQQFVKQISEFCSD